MSKNQVEEIDKAMLRSIVFRQPYLPGLNPDPFALQYGGLPVVRYDLAKRDLGSSLRRPKAKGQI